LDISFFQSIGMESVVHHLARIVQAVALTDQPLEQVNLVVESISTAMNVDVCSLYLVNASGEMMLLASHGLAAKSVRKAKLPPGAGLVGLVASSRHTINLSDAESHPDYYFIPETGEERYHSFCGVPLVNVGTVIGVMVVQCRKRRELSREEEGFLVTLAAHLALLLEGNPLASSGQLSSDDRYTGIRGAPGVGIGNVLLSDHGELYSVLDAPCHDSDAEVARWQQLVQRVDAEIVQEQLAVKSELSDSVASIFSAYRMLLEDPSFASHVETGIRAGNWLPGALRKATRHFADQFLAMDDLYLKARHEDIHYLGNKLYRAWRGIESSTLLPTDKSVVLAGAQVSVSEIAAIPVAQLAGIVCFQGSSLSHTAVLANALGVPAVMGTGSIRGLTNDMLVIVDGNSAQLFTQPPKALLSEYRKLVDDRNVLNERLKSLRDLPATTTDGVEIALYTNTGLLADISPGLLNGAQGVGLYRTEIPFMIRDSFPSEEEQVAVYREVLQAYDGKPVHMRTLDIGGDKQLPYFPIENESNPALGWRGIRFTLDNSQLMMTQLRAMIRAAEGRDNLRILLPMVSSSSEIEGARELLSDALAQLQSEGYAVAKPQIGVMIEIPAAISQIPLWKDQIDFVSIGSNDLSQYLLALDRDNPRVAARYDHIHPAVLCEIQRIVQVCSRLGIPLSLCGEMASDLEAVVLLMGLGVRTLSMSASRLPYVRWLIRSLSISVVQKLAQQALEMRHSGDIRLLVRDALVKEGLAEIFN
jgi:phosphoenolpyruvate-protein phosphotransferase